MEGHTAGAVLPAAIGGLPIVFAAWWMYFAVPGHTYITSTRTAFLWSYGHYAIFAATGAGLEVAGEHATGHAHISTTTAGAAVTIPTALFLVCVHATHARPHATSAAQYLILPTAALATLGSTYSGTAAIPLTGPACVLATAALLVSKRTPRRAEAGSAGPLPLRRIRQGEASSLRQTAKRGRLALKKVSSVKLS